MKSLLEFIPVIGFVMMTTGAGMWVLEEFAGDGSAIPIAKRLLFAGAIVLALSGILFRFIL